MKNLKIMLYKSNQKRDGSYPVCLRISKDGKRKYVNLGLSAMEGQWNEEADRFKKDKRVYPNYERDNLFLNSCEERAGKLLMTFAEKQKIWSLIQFEEEFCCKDKGCFVYDIIIKRIERLNATDHIGNAVKPKETLRMLLKFDKRFKERICEDIDVEYVKAFNAFLEERGCVGNTRRIYLSPLRAALNDAEAEKKCSPETKPFGKGKFEMGKLSEKTVKRYLLSKELELIKNSIQENSVLERARRLFLFSYYCFGMNMIDMAKLTSANIKILPTGEYIVYKRHKTQHAKDIKPLYVLVTTEIRELLDWFKQNTSLLGDYLLPILTKEYIGEQAYNHYRTRYKRLNDNMKRLGTELETNIELTSYVARHTMAMRLQQQEVPRECISQVMGHTNLETTNTYLDSFDTSVVDKIINLL